MQTVLCLAATACCVLNSLAESRLPSSNFHWQTVLGFPAYFLDPLRVCVAFKVVATCQQCQVDFHLRHGNSVTSTEPAIREHHQSCKPLSSQSFDILISDIRWFSRTAKQLSLARPRSTFKTTHKCRHNQLSLPYGMHHLFICVVC